ncbi:hypothetical protein [Actinomycetospora cinnamomea]|uniref:Uncharacterized protein n=1 Tax=Actinomycetospora cinnamomea TaxID=663609 RepID=A0A2U1F6P3_9PSEU|nr:hypothetical protein [Actinomycetospora cinnamomea]PVZ07855.1 hypothetical protein C8D89_1108 [Actinomycetospora cinnamomea]
MSWTDLVVRLLADTKLYARLLGLLVLLMPVAVAVTALLIVLK